MNIPRIVIAGTHSGVGKSTVSLGLMAAFQDCGLTVQGFKVGPDYIDPSYHTAITGRPSRNLDSWMLSKDMVRDVFLRASRDADLSIVEGVMGLYDGKDVLSNEGSTAGISVLLDCPVLLVVDCSGMARSAAAIVKGYQALDDRVFIAGVIANRVGGEGHFLLIKEAVEHECGVPVVGYLTREPDIEIPERHLGLIPAIERGEYLALMEKLSAVVSSTIDLPAVLELARSASELPDEYSPILKPPLASPFEWTTKATIAVARDAVFNFYYEDNLDLLEHYGAKLLFFSPLAGEKVPEDADGVYLGGGFPEEYAALLSAREDVMGDLRQRISDGLPTYAECGGYMYLSESLTDVRGDTYKMVGVIPAHVQMQSRLCGFGYREVTGRQGNWLIASSQPARGHEFHYSTIEYRTPVSPAYSLIGNHAPKAEGYLNANVVAGYTHLHFGSNPVLADQLITRCVEYGRTR